MSEECPSCGSLMQGEPIPQEYIDRGGYGNLTHYSRRVGYDIRGVYDGVLIWGCPDCGHLWPRFSEPDGRHEKAVQIIAEWRGLVG